MDSKNNVLISISHAMRTNELAPQNFGFEVRHSIFFANGGFAICIFGDFPLFYTDRLLEGSLLAQNCQTKVVISRHGTFRAFTYINEIPRNSYSYLSALGRAV